MKLSSSSLFSFLIEMRATIAASAAPIAPAYAAALPPPGTGASEERSSLTRAATVRLSDRTWGRGRSVRASILRNFIRDPFHAERLRERPDDASATGGVPLWCQFRPDE